MSAEDLKARLLADRVRVETEGVDIDGVGTVFVRGLSRYEFMLCQKRFPDNEMAQERASLALAMVDPSMTEDEIETWQKNSPPKEINTVSMAVNRLSGIAQGADKSGVEEA